jgi:tetratricopeptide (TPR) repeat protein
VKISPAWGTAARELAAARERSGDFAAAKAAMEQAIQRAPLDAYNHGGLAQMLWKLGEKTAALERLAQAVRLEPGYEWAWGRLGDWARELGRREVPEGLARDLTERRGGEARSWMVLAQVLEGPERIEERLRALETAIRLNPRLSDARDLQAVLLAGAGRFKEALDACGGDDAPLILRGRAAWIESRRGNRPAAIAKMSRAVKDDPTYYWGWMQLADWHSEEGSKKEYLDAARHMVRLAPQNEAALGYLADAKLKSGDRAGAKADFRRSIELEPDYSLGTLTLFDLHFEDGELDAASSVLALAKKHIGGPYVLARDVQLAAKQKRIPEALDSLRAVCMLPTEHRWPLDASLRALAAAGASAQARETLLAAAMTEKVNPLAGGVWSRDCAEARLWKDCREGLARLEGRPGVWAEAASEFARGLATARETAQLDEFLSGETARLRQDTLTWGAVGNALESVGSPLRCVEWMSDWKTRKGVEPWMLSALVVSLRALERNAEALEVGRGALAMPPDHSYPLHRLWVAFEDAVGGDAGAARAAAAEIDPEALSPYYRSLRHLLLAALDASVDHLKSAAAAMPEYGKHAALRLAHRQALGRIARSQGGLKGIWTRLRHAW